MAAPAATTRLKAPMADNVGNRPPSGLLSAVIIIPLRNWPMAKVALHTPVTRPRMLNARPPEPPIPREVFERILEEERADRSDEWLSERT